MKLFRENKELLILFIIAFGLRFFLVMTAGGIADDGCGYAFLARDIINGDFNAIYTSIWPPLFPSLTAAAYWVFGNIELAGRMISCIAGSLTVFPLFFLCRDIFCKKTALAAVFFYTIHPYLTQASGMVLTEALHFFLFTAIVSTSWIALQKRKPFIFLLTGVLLFLAAFTRFESFVLIVLVVGWIWFNNSFRFWRDIRLKLTGTICCLFFFITLLAGYTGLLHQQTGHWQPCPRIEHYKQTLLTPVSEHQTAVQKTAAVLKANLPVSISRIPQYFAKAYYPVLLPLLVIGLIRHKDTPRRPQGEFFVLSFIILRVLTLFVFAGINARYLYAFIPIALGWAGRGFTICDHGFRNKFKDKLCFVGKIEFSRYSFILLALIAVICLPGALKSIRKHRTTQKAVGLWIKDDAGTRSVVVASPNPQEAFYADAVWHKLHGNTFEDIVVNARNKNADYLLVDKNIGEFCRDYETSTAKNTLEIATNQFADSDQKTVIYRLTKTVPAEKPEP